MSKKALIAVSFGTTYPYAIKSIEKIENKLKNSMPQYDFYRSFTSNTVIKRIYKNQNIIIKSPQETLEQLFCDGYEDVICQSLHVINGFEFNKMCVQIKPFNNKFNSIKIGEPLLTSINDYIVCANTIMNNFLGLSENEALVLMGHGTEHIANSSYLKLEDTIRSLGHKNVYVGTIEGTNGIDYIERCLNTKNIKKVYLMPFMIVAGDHAQNDLAGANSESWNSILKLKGYQTEVILKGLGEFDEISNLFLEHLKN